MTYDDPPVVVPRHVLDRPDMIRACAGRDFGKVFALCKRYAGISNVRIGAALEMTASRIGSIVAGKSQITSIETVERVSDRLRIPEHLLGLASRPWESSVELDGDEAGGLADLAVILGYEDRAVTADRAIRIAQRWLVTEPPQRTELAAGRRIGTGLVDRLESRINHLRHIDDFVGGGDSHAIVVSELDATVTVVRDGTYLEHVGNRLLTAVGELCQLAGWVLDDADEHPRAARYYVAGMHAAQAAGNTPLAANLLSTLSYQIANVSNPNDAVLLARSALHGAEAQAAPVARALFWDRTAWAYARNGDRAGCERALGAAADAYEGRAGDRPEPTWVYWLTREELDIMAGRCMTELNQPARAEPLLSMAIACYDQTHARELALYLSWLAEAHVKGGEIEQACAEAAKALELIDGVNSTRAHERITVIRRALRPYGEVPAVREFDERYRLVYGPAV